jgi:hypothetical protein
MSKGGGKQTQTQTSDPWGPSQQYIAGALGDAAKWYGSDYGRQYFPGSTVVPFNPMTEQALGMTAQRAINGSPLMQAAQQQNLATQRGDFLRPDSNPFLSQTFDTAAGKVRGALDSQFNRNNSYGGSMHQGAMADNLNNLASQMYGQNYNQERDRMTAATTFAPQLAQQDYYDAGRLAAVGDAYQQQAGNYVNDAMQRWDFYQNQPFQRLQQFASLINPVAGMGGTQVGQTKQPSNTLSNIIGIASTAAGLPIWSDPAVKDDIVRADDDEVIEAASKAPGYTYTYKTDADKELRIGPMADEYAAAYGGDGKTIFMPQMIGAMWTAMSAMARKIRELESEQKERGR